MAAAEQYPRRLPEPRFTTKVSPTACTNNFIASVIDNPGGSKFESDILAKVSRLDLNTPSTRHEYLYPYPGVVERGPCNTHMSRVSSIDLGVAKGDSGPSFAEGGSSARYTYIHCVAFPLCRKDTGLEGPWAPGSERGTKIPCSRTSI